MIEVQFETDDKFLVIKETLERIGVPSKDGTKLYQSCHIFHTKGKYYIVHFKKMFELNGKAANWSPDDESRTETIAKLLEEWGLLKVLSPLAIEKPNMKMVKIVPFKDREKWELIPKYRLGKKKDSVSNG